jgi:hypothetical protein
LVVLNLAAVGIATVIEQHANPPTCIGLGFGCIPDAVTTVVLGGMFVGVPVLAIAWTSIVAGWLVTQRRSDRINHRATWWPAWLLAGCLAMVVAIAAITAGCPRPTTATSPGDETHPPVSIAGQHKAETDCARAGGDASSHMANRRE